MTSRGETGAVPRQARLFPERRVYIRTGQRTRYFALGATSQIAVIAVIGLAMGWTAFATTSYVRNAVDVQSAQQQASSIREAYEARIGALETRQIRLEEELNRANERREAATARLSEKQQYLVDTAYKLREAETELSTLRREADEMTRRAREAEDRIERLAGELTSLRVALADSEASREGLAASVGRVSDAIDGVISERDFAVARRASLTDRVAELETEVADYESRQERLLAQLESAAKVGLSGLERMFERANLDLDKILGKVRRDYSGSGGPFEPLDAAQGAIDEAADRRVAALIQDLEQVNLMRFAAQRLPFTLPVKGMRFTSGFGARRDPFRGRISQHDGIDFAGPHGTKIVSPADGVVTFAGRQRGYGNVVKIRHAFGFETVYAHLARARVTVGERVERGDLIAEMGNTGRSTGTHLHYEVRIDNTPVDPMKFIEAARDVL